MSVGARRERIATWITILALSGWMGCGGNSPNGSGGESPDGSGGAPGYTFATSVDGGAPLNGLTPSQAAQLCADISAAADGGFQATSCNAVNQGFAVNAAYIYLQDNPGASTAALQAKCESFLHGEQSSGCVPPATCDVSVIRNNMGACAATVADEVTCINENAMIDEAFLKATPSCTSVSASILNRYFADGGAFDQYNVVPHSASCAALANCIGISP
jgi:hypothetical protein